MRKGEFGGKNPRLPGNTLKEKLALNSVRDGACLRWTGAHRAKGYGAISVAGRMKAVHRVTYEIHFGSIPEGYEVDHVHAKGCRFRDCIEPTHLEAVTHAENVVRSSAVIPLPEEERIKRCVRGHDFTPENSVWTARSSRKHPTRECRECRRFHHQKSKRNRRQREAAAIAEATHAVMTEETISRG